MAPRNAIQMKVNRANSSTQGSDPPKMAKYRITTDQKRQTVRAAVEAEGPFYIRLGRGETRKIFEEGNGFQVGKVRRLSDGPDVAIVASGPLVSEAIQAETSLRSEGIAASVLDMHTIKPADEETIIAVAKQTGAIVTVEDHNILGGLGGTISEILCKHSPIPVEMIGIRDRYGESGDLSELMELYGLTAHHIVDAAKRAIERKNRNGSKGDVRS
jgi:transketolase